MAIRPIKGLTGLSLPIPSRKFKTCREIPKDFIFINLFITGLEHLLIYCRGKQLTEYFSNTLNIIPTAQSSEFQAKHKDAFDDLEDLFDKKQLKILNALIFDDSFLSFLTELGSLLEVPESKSSEAEYFHVIEYYSSRLKINVLMINSKGKEFKILVENPFTNITIFKDQTLLILYPYEYIQYHSDSTFRANDSDLEDMRKNNESPKNQIQDKLESLRQKSLPTSPLLFRKSPTKYPTSEELKLIRELETENRMRARSKIAQDKRKQQNVMKKSAETQIFSMNTENTLNSINLKNTNFSIDNSLFRNASCNDISIESRSLSKNISGVTAIHSNIKHEELDSQLEIQKEQEKQRNIEEWLKRREEAKEKLKTADGRREFIEQNKLQEEMIKRDEERKREEDRIIEESRILEEKRKEIEKKIAEKRKQAEEKRKEDQRKLAEQKRILDETHLLNEKKLLEDRIAHEKAQQERKLLEDKKFQEEKKIAEDKRIQADKRLEEVKARVELKSSDDRRNIDEKRAELERKLLEKKRLEEEQRIQEEKKIAEVQRLLDERKAAKEKKLAEERRAADERKIIEEKKIAEQRKVIEELRRSEESRLANERKVIEEMRIIENQRKALEIHKKAEALRLEEIRLAEENRKQAEIKEAEESKRQKAIEVARSTELARQAEEKRKQEEKKKQEEIIKEKERKKNEELKRKQEEDQKQIELKKLQDLKAEEEKRLLEEQKAEEKRQLLQRKQQERRLAEERKAEESRIIEEKQRKIEEEKKRIEEQKRLKSQQEEVQNDNTSFCGGLYCAKCAKELKRSNYILKCGSCNDRYLKTHSSSSPAAAKVPISRSCMNCGLKITKGEEVQCMRCFLQSKIFGEAFCPCLDCIRKDQCYWIDAGDGDPKIMELCGFCDEMKVKESIILICPTCEDKICMICLRRNPYVAQAICSHCHNRRQPTLIRFKN